MRVPYLKPQTVERLQSALDDVHALVTEGHHPEEALVKVAEEYRLGPHHIVTVARAYNVGSSLYALQTGNDITTKSAVGEIIDPANVIRKVYPDTSDEEIKTAEFVPILPTSISIGYEEKIAEIEKKAEAPLKVGSDKPVWLEDSFEAIDRLKVEKEKLELAISDMSRKFLQKMAYLETWARRNPEKIDHVCKEASLRYGPEAPAFLLHAARPVYDPQRQKRIPDLWEKSADFPGEAILELLNLSKEIERAKKLHQRLERVIEEKKAALLPKEVNYLYYFQPERSDIAPSEIKQADNSVNIKIPSNFRTRGTVERIRMQQHIADWIVNDEQIGRFDPDEVYDAAEFIIDSVPQTLDHPLVLKSVLIQYLNSGGNLDVQTIKALAESFTHLQR